MAIERSEKEHKYTSTGIKFWRHKSQMEAYRSGSGKTVISTHIAPEGACNLKCPYCSVTYRKTSNRIDINVIKDYVLQLKMRGLKAVILTGGGEPTIYPQFSDLVTWLYEEGLKIALITNGTMTNRVRDEVWKMFTWVRMSINVFEGWKEKIQLPTHLFSDKCVIGSSFVMTQKHENHTELEASLLREVAQVARRSNARYVRLLPNCLLPQMSLIESHELLSKVLSDVGDDIFFHQMKLHGAPQCAKCHQAYFRPYLSEVPYRGTNKPGSVYPCDSVVLNDAIAKFSETYQLCEPGDIGKYLDGKIEQKFDAQRHCSGCVFTDNVNMLDDWKVLGRGKFSEEILEHEEFV